MPVPGADRGPLAARVLPLCAVLPGASAFLLLSVLPALRRARCPTCFCCRPSLRSCPLPPCDPGIKVGLEAAACPVTRRG